MIYISHNDLDQKFIVDSINFFKENIIHTYVWDETRVLGLNRYGFNEVNPPEIYFKILDLVKLIKSNVDGDERFLDLQEVEIVKYPCGAHKNFHYDKARKTTTGASITYINDGYIGGNTIIEGVDVQPISGRTVYFDGKKYRHAVSNVIKGDRYTLSMWYGKDKTMPINKEFLEI